LVVKEQAARALKREHAESASMPNGMQTGIAALDSRKIRHIRLPKWRVVGEGAVGTQQRVGAKDPRTIDKYRRRALAGIDLLLDGMPHREKLIVLLAKIEELNEDARRADLHQQLSRLGNN
jgi:hypothetical protein